MKLLLPAVVGFSLVSLSDEARAAPPRQREDRLGGAYFHLSPGPVAVVIHQHKFSREARWIWPWSLGAGWKFRRGSVFKATLGAALEHRVMVLEHVTPHGFHALVESRIGVGNNRVWGYGLVGVGGAAIFVNWRRYVSEDFYGVVGQFGGGVQGLVRRRFFVGGELDFDVGYHFSIHEENHRSGEFYYQTMTVELIFGWYF